MTDPRALLDDTFARYAALPRYSDRGTAKRTVETAFGPHDATIEIATAFVRPDRFRFHLRHKKLGAPSWNHGVVCRSRRTIRHFAFDPPATDEAPTLDAALLPLLAPSIGTAITIGHLLLPNEIDDRTLRALESPTIEGEVDVRGHRCVHLAARHPVSGGRFELWIDATTKLVRRIFRPPTASYDLTGTVVDYEPDLDAAIDDALFDGAHFER